MFGDLDFPQDLVHKNEDKLREAERVLNDPKSTPEQKEKALKEKEEAENFNKNNGKW